jgi:hypothetical protein
MLVNTIKKSTLPHTVEVMETWLKQNAPYDLTEHLYFLPFGTEMPQNIDLAFYALTSCGILSQSRNQDGRFLQFLDDPYRATVTRKAMRLPRVEYLLLLTPDDFISFMEVVGNSKVINDTLLQLPADVPGFENISRFFEIQKINFRVSAAYASKQGWITHETLNYLYIMSASIEATEYQMAVCQYIAAAQLEFNEVFPASTSSVLEFGDVVEFQNLNYTDEYIKLQH